jgi:hypothetical protein
MHEVEVLTVSDGKIVRREAYAELEDALDAVGLPSPPERSKAWPR